MTDLKPGDIVTVTHMPTAPTPAWVPEMEPYVNNLCIVEETSCLNEEPPNIGLSLLDSKHKQTWYFQPDVIKKL